MPVFIRAKLVSAGVYKPRIRCYDVAQLSMKFERCMDSEVVKMMSIADDYSKVCATHHNRPHEHYSIHARCSN